MNALENRVLFSTFTVSNLLDSGAGSLRDAVAAANSTAGYDTVAFQSGLTGTITLASGELSLTDPAGVSVQGPGSALITVSGNDATRVFSIPASAAADISGLTLTLGFGSSGGGIITSGGTVNLSDCVVSHGRTFTNGGAINNSGVMGITDCAIQDSGGAAFVGGGIFNGGTLTLLRSTVSNNRGVFGAGIANFSNLTVTASTISGNHGVGLNQQSQGSGTYRMIVRDSTIIDNEDAGVFGLVRGDSRVVLLNTTIARNGVGIEAGNQGSSQPPSISAWMTAINCTVTQNTVGVSVYSTAYTELANSIVAGNTSSDVTGSITSIAGNFIGGDPMLGALGNYGGPTQTYMPLPGSPVIDAGNTNLARYFGPDGEIGTGDDQPLTTDQRGTGFARVSGARVDAGSFEVQTVAVTLATDPSAASRTALIVQGTVGSDVIAIAAVAGSSQVDVTANSIYIGRYTFSGRLILQGGDGDDVITVDPRLSRDVIIYGDGGNDTITTGRGNDVIVGGDGADHLFSVNGDDILIGGNGEDVLESGNGQDILIGGRTSYDSFTDANIKAVSQLSDAWSSSFLYPINVILISIGIGPSYPYKLNASTVFDDAARDILKGSSGFDWYVGNFSGSGIKDATDRGLLDILTDL